MAIGLLPVLAALVSPVALADEDGRERDADTFQGTCQFSGTLRQKPPLTNTPQAGEASARARGRCSGTLTDEEGKVRRLDDARARYAARAAGTMSCAGGTAEGSGHILLRGERLRFRFSEVRGPGAGAIRLDGAHGGSAAGEARVSDEEDPLEIAQKCGGAGLSRVQVDIDIATTPSISG